MPFDAGNLADAMIVVRVDRLGLANDLRGTSNTVANGLANTSAFRSIGSSFQNQFSYIGQRAGASFVTGFARSQSQFTSLANTAKGYFLGGLSLAGVNSLAGGIAGLTRQVFSLNTGLEKSSVAYEVMLGSADKAQDVIQRLRKFAADTPFELPELNQVARGLLTFGERGDQMMETLKMLGNAASGTSSDFGMIGLIFNQIRGAGKLLTQDFRQLSTRGVLFLSDIAKYYKVTEQAAQDMLSHGKIKFEDVRNIFKSLSAEGGRFHNMMEKQAQTFDGLASTLRDNFGTALMNAGKPLFDLGKVTLKNLVDFFGSDEAVKWTSRISGGLTTIIDKLKSLASNQMVMSAAKFIALGAAGMSAFKVIAVGAGLASTAMGVILSPMTAVALGASAIGLSLKSALSGSSGEKLADTFREIKSLAWNIYANIYDLVIPAIESVKSLASGMFGSESTGMNDKFWLSVSSGIKSTLEFVGVMTNSWPATWEVMKTSGSAAVGYLGDRFEYLWGTQIPTMVDASARAVVYGVGTMADKWRDIWNGAINATQKLFTAFIDIQVERFKNIGEAFARAWDLLKSGSPGQAMRALGEDLAANEIKMAKKTLQAGVDAGKAFADTAGKAMREVGRNSAQAFNEVFDKMPQFNMSYDTIEAMKKASEAYHDARNAFEQKKQDRLDDSAMRAGEALEDRLREASKGKGKQAIDAASDWFDGFLDRVSGKGEEAKKDGEAEGKKKENDVKNTSVEGLHKVIQDNLKTDKTAEVANKQLSTQEKMRDALEAINDKIGAGAADFAKDVTGSATAPLNAVQDALSGKMPNVSSAVDGLASGLGSLVDKIGSGIASIPQLSDDEKRYFDMKKKRQENIEFYDRIRRAAEHYENQDSKTGFDASGKRNINDIYDRLRRASEIAEREEIGQEEYDKIMDKRSRDLLDAENERTRDAINRNRVEQNRVNRKNALADKPKSEAEKRRDAARKRAIDDRASKRNEYSRIREANKRAYESSRSKTVKSSSEKTIQPPAKSEKPSKDADIADNTKKMSVGINTLIDAVKELNLGYGE